MSEARRTLPKELDAFLGDFKGLLHQIGLSCDLDLPRESTSAPRVVDLRTFRMFLQQYASETLFPIELPAICKAYFHSARYEGRELMALDRNLADDPRLTPFKRSSAEIGKAHLFNLRPLRENRLVQRYIAHVEAGQAEGYHSVVFGLSLSLYSVPLRQGLLSYATRVMDSFALSAIAALGLRADDVRPIVEEIAAELPQQVDALLKADEGLFKAA